MPCLLDLRKAKGLLLREVEEAAASKAESRMLI